MTRTVIPGTDGRACVFAPSVVLTVTIEEAGADADDIHLHVGGQGFWVARLMAELGAEVVLVGPFGGETGAVLECLVAGTGIALRTSTRRGSNGAYVHDRRGGERVVVADRRPTPLSRHEVDELYGKVLVEALQTDVCVLTGSGVPAVLPAETYGRLAHDVRAGGVTAVADLSGDELAHAVRGGLSVLKVSTEDLRRDGWVRSDDDAEIAEALRVLTDAGADTVVVTDAARGATVLTHGELLAIFSPVFEPVERRGAGDSLTAGVAAGLARGASMSDALRLGVAAGALNVTRRGLGSGARDDIEAFAEQITVRAVGGRT